MIEFKQIIGRGTRLYEEKSYFTIIDFVGASENFSDPEWDGVPVPEEPKKPKPINPVGPEQPPGSGGDFIDPEPPRQKILIKLAEGKELAIQSMSTTLFMVDGNPISSEEFIKKLFNTIKLPSFFNSEEELRKIWSSPITRKELLNKLEQNGFSKQDLKSIQSLIEAEDSDLFDVLERIAYSKQPISRIERVTKAEDKIHANLNDRQKEFIDFVLERYALGGVEELDMDRLSDLITLKYRTVSDGQKALGDIDGIKNMFIGFQKHLYQQNNQ
jgi:type I restriction enzyme R subunit